MNIQTTDENIKDERLVIDSDTENDPPMNPSSTPTLDMSVESSSDTDDRNDYEMPNKNLVTGVLPFKVTLRDIAFHEKLLEMMKSIYKYQQKNQCCSNDSDLAIEYTEPGSERVEIEPGTGIYLPANTIKFIERRAEKSKGFFDWKILVRDTLQEIYGRTIKNYSAKGSRINSRPSINPQLFKALYYWVNRKSEKHIFKEEIVRHINRIASNRRKYNNAGNQGETTRKNKQTTSNSVPSVLASPQPIPSTSISSSSIPSTSRTSTSTSFEPIDPTTFIKLPSSTSQSISSVPVPPHSIPSTSTSFELIHPTEFVTSPPSTSQSIPSSSIPFTFTTSTSTSLEPIRPTKFVTVPSSTLQSIPLVSMPSHSIPLNPIPFLPTSPHISNYPPHYLEAFIHGFNFASASSNNTQL
ncbi:hypothetical protein PV325_002344 [Microctonus aethiopoides]|nr:hypothetical protein PV325_002344 [Microctonus aethiopoides]KAK0094804.1 hypothetical protein PV326_009962 [Microctonus aethiopoides]